MHCDRLARRRAAALILLVAAAVALAGCTAAGGAGVKASGTNLVVYTSVPPGLAGESRVQDLLAAERLALRQGGSSVDKYTISLSTLDGNQLSDNARTAIRDSHAIAYLGEVIPGQSADSIGITNAVDLLQVSPTDTAQALTQTTPAVPGSSKRYYESYGAYGQTFARMVPTTVREATAVVQEMRLLRVSSLYLADDGSDYGKALAASVRRLAPPISVRSSSSGVDAVMAAASSETQAARVFDAATAASPGVKLFAPSALDTERFASRLSPTAQHALYVSAPGYLNKDLSPAGRQFVARFVSTYGRSPTPDAVFGYEAMSAVLAALRQAGAAANQRATVVKDFLALNEASSALGPFRMDKSGDTTVSAPIVFSRLRGGRLVPSASITPAG